MTTFMIYPERPKQILENKKLGASWEARMYMGKFNVVFYVAQYVFSSTETEWPKDILKIHRKSYLFY